MTAALVTSVIGLEAYLRLSASQVQAFRNCQRAWAFHYVAKVPEAPKPAAELGGKVHKQLETYLLGGDIDFTTEVGYIAASGLEHIPKPGTPGMRVEQEFHFEGPSGHSYLGYKDVELPPSSGQPGLVLDHKTTGDFRWQKTSEDLETDVQAVLYAVDYFRKHPEERELDLKWVYYHTKNTRKSAVTHLRVFQEPTWTQFLEIEKTAEEMSAAWETLESSSLPLEQQPLLLPPNVNHCSAYGGCPHQGRCNLSPWDRLRSHAMQQNKLLDAVNAKKNGALVAPQAAPPAVAPQAAPPAVALPVSNALLSRLHAKGVATSTPIVAAVNPPEWQPPPSTVVSVEAAPAPTGLPTWATAPIDPRVRSAAAGLIAPGEAIPDPYVLSPQLRPSAVAPASVAPVAAPTAAVAPASATPAAAKRGRPRKETLDMARFVVLYPGVDPTAVTADQVSALNAQMLLKMPAAFGAVPPLPAVPPPVAAPPVATTPLPVEVPVAALVVEPPTPTVQTAPVAHVAPVQHKIGVLYINCAPVGQPVVDANVFVMQAKQRIAAEGLADYRFADYGKGAGMLAVACAASVDGAPSMSAVRLDTTTPEGSIVAVELAARAGLVVR